MKKKKWYLIGFVVFLPYVILMGIVGIFVLLNSFVVSPRKTVRILKEGWHEEKEKRFTE